MKPVLSKKYGAYLFHELTAKFNEGAPITQDELNFLSNHEKTLSHLGELMRYYMKPFHDKTHEHASFLLHTDELNQAAIRQLKERILLLLGNQKSLTIPISVKQFDKLRQTASRELIYFRGNQYLTGAPFYPGGIAPVIFFQWGNMFAVAKYVVLAEEKALKSNVLIYFENMLERELDECVNEYIKIHQLELIEKPRENPTPIEHATLSHQPSHSIPRLTLAMYHPDGKDKK